MHIYIYIYTCTYINYICIYVHPIRVPEKILRGHGLDCRLWGCFELVVSGGAQKKTSATEGSSSLVLRGQTGGCFESEPVASCLGPGVVPAVGSVA